MIVFFGENSPNISKITNITKSLSDLNSSTSFYQPLCWLTQVDATLCSLAGMENGSGCCTGLASCHVAMNMLCVSPELANGASTPKGASLQVRIVLQMLYRVGSAIICLSYAA